MNEICCLFKTITFGFKKNPSIFAVSFLFQVSTNSKTKIFFSASFLISSVKNSLGLSLNSALINFLTSSATFFGLLLILKTGKILSNFMSESSAIAESDILNSSKWLTIFLAPILKSTSNFVFLKKILASFETSGDFGSK